MCGCGRNTTQNQAQPNVTPRNETLQADCNYTIDTINSWKTMFECVNDQNALGSFNIQRALYNSFIGVLLSAQRSPTYICNFNKELNIMQSYVLQIIDSGIC